MASSKSTENGSLRPKLSKNGRSTDISNSRLNLEDGQKKALSKPEEALLAAAEAGDLDSVRQLLKDGQINADFADAFGRTPLRLAVSKDHVEVVDILLKCSNNTIIREALLQAINNENDQMAEFILKFLSERDDAKERQKFGEDDYFFSQYQEGSQFSADTTPLILAAWKNRFNIVLILLRSGERIATPHRYYCGCLDCRNKIKFDELRLAKTRLNAYRGLASEAYVSLSSKDPILEAFKLGKELRAIAEIEKCYKTEYLELADALSEYVVKLLDKVRGHDELEVILNKVGVDLEECSESFELLERFKLAIEYNEKKFVAHPCCQQRLIRIWYSDMRILERANLFMKFLMGSSIMIAFPLLAICYWVAPKSKLGRFIQSPCVKFIGRLVSVLVFMVMILISSLAGQTFIKLTSYEEFRNYTSRTLLCISDTKTCTDPSTFILRQTAPNVIDLLIMIWVLGMFWQEVKQMYQNGVIGYFNSLFNYLDTAVLVLYLVSYSLKISTMFRMNSALEYFRHDESWQKLYSGEDEAKHQMYWMLADRFFWDMYDPEHLAEGAFAVANIISFTRIIYVFPAHELLGPLQISLARMAKDILTFVVIFMVLFMAFFIGMHNLYWYYPPETRNNYELFDNNIVTEAEEYFGILDKTFRTVFWAAIGQANSKYVQLGAFNNKFTENIGYWIFGAYSVAIVIVLLNMLIAMMTRSFDTIQSEAHTEWKFARSKLYMEYIKEDGTLPVPFNIVPAPKSLWYAVRTICNCMMSGEDPGEVYHPGRIGGMDLYHTQSTSSTDTMSPQVTPSKNSIFDPAIRRFRKQLSTRLARQTSEASMFNAPLTYERVMNRIIRRYMFDKHLAACDEYDAKQDGLNHRSEVQKAVNESQRATTSIIRDLESKVTHLADLVLRLKNGEITLPEPENASKQAEVLRSSLGQPSVAKHVAENTEKHTEEVTGSRFSERQALETLSTERNNIAIERHAIERISTGRQPRKIFSTERQATERQATERQATERHVVECYSTEGNATGNQATERHITERKTTPQAVRHSRETDLLY